MRTAEGAKCASDPHVDCALRYGRKSDGVHWLASVDGVLGLPLGTLPRPDHFRPVSGPPQDTTVPSDGFFGDGVNHRRPGL